MKSTDKLIDGRMATLRSTTTDPFKPTDISSCVLWLDADLSTKIYSSGTSISSISDLSKQDNNCTNLGNYPTYSASSINGRGAIDFNGSQWLETPSKIGITRYSSWFVVFNSRSVNAIALFGIKSELSAANRIGVFFTGSNYLRTHSFDDGNDASKTWATNTWYLLSFFGESNGNTQRRNGTSLGKTINTTGKFNDNLILQIGGFLNGTVPYFNGKIASIIGYNKTLTLTETGLVENYLNGLCAIY